MYYEPLESEETVSTKRYQQQLTDLNRFLLEKKTEYRNKQQKILFFHNNAPSLTAKSVGDTLEALSWEVLPRATYSPDLAPSDCHLLASMSHARAEQRLGSYEDVKKWLDEWFAAKEGRFLLAWYSQIDRKMGKMYNTRRSIL